MNYKKSEAKEAAIEQFRGVVDKLPDTTSAAEAQYWAGVSKYTGGDASALPATAAAFKQPLSLQEHVGGSLALGGVGQSLHPIELGNERQVFEGVCFVHECPVDPQLFESHGPRKAFAFLQASLAAQEPCGEALDGLLNGFFGGAP